MSADLLADATRQYARDLAAWIVQVVERGTVGQPGATFTWVPADFLEKEKVQPWSDLPVWIPATGEYAGVGTTSNARAVAAGLRFRPVADTARDTLAWVNGLPEDERAKVTRGGLTPEREAAVLASWHRKRKS